MPPPGVEVHWLQRHNPLAGLEPAGFQLVDDTPGFSWTLVLRQRAGQLVYDLGERNLLGR